MCEYKKLTHLLLLFLYFSVYTTRLSLQTRVCNHHHPPTPYSVVGFDSFVLGGEEDEATFDFQVEEEETFGVRPPISIVAIIIKTGVVFYEF